MVTEGVGGGMRQEVGAPVAMRMTDMEQSVVYPSPRGSLRDPSPQTRGTPSSSSTLRVHDSSRSSRNLNSGNRNRDSYLATQKPCLVRSSSNPLSVPRSNTSSPAINGDHKVQHKDPSPVTSGEWAVNYDSDSYSTGSLQRRSGHKNVVGGSSQKLSQPIYSASPPVNNNDLQYGPKSAGRSGSSPRPKNGYLSQSYNGAPGLATIAAATEDSHKPEVSQSSRRSIKFDSEMTGNKLAQSLDTTMTRMWNTQKSHVRENGHFQPNDQGHLITPRRNKNHLTPPRPSNFNDDPNHIPQPSHGNWKYGDTIFEILDTETGQEYDFHDCNGRLGRAPEDALPSSSMSGWVGDQVDASCRPRSSTVLGADTDLSKEQRPAARNNFIRYRTHSEDHSVSKYLNLGISKKDTVHSHSDPSTPTTYGLGPPSQDSPRGAKSGQLKLHLQTISENLGALVRKKSVNKKNSLGSSASSSGSMSQSTMSCDSIVDTPPVVVTPSDTTEPVWPKPRIHTRHRSNSEPSILDLDDDADNGVDFDNGNDSDNDKDDYGFLSYPSYRMRLSMLNSVTLQTAMQKSSPVSGSKGPGGSGVLSSASGARGIFNKKWRGRSKGTSPSPKTQPIWKPEGSGTWCSTEGKKLVLSDTSLLRLTDKERMVLQKLSVAKLQAMNLGCPITIPKDWCNGKRSKKSGFSLKRRTGSSSILENLRDRGRDKDSKESGTGWVFGIPIGKVIANDLELRRRRPSIMRERRESLDLPHSHSQSRESSSSSVSRKDRLKSRKARNQTVAVCHCRSIGLIHSRAFHKTAHGGGLSCESLSEADTKASGSNLLDALSLSSVAQMQDSGTESSHEGRDQTLLLHSPKVPYIVKSCCQHLETYGLQVLGIFRIGNSKKRTKQLREEFDSGKDVKLNEQHNPHDVGGLLKEFFRDLTDPLLTRDLYSAFIATRKIQCDEQRLHALRLLISLLPPANRDTLWSLLKFLNTVSQHSTDSIDDNGQEVPGNKMDSHNLATLFGPNILHKAKGGEFQVESLDRAEERKDIINIIQELINHYQQVFQLSAELHDETMRLLWETNPDAVDFLLKQRCSSSTSMPQGMEVDPETSTSSYNEGSDSSSIPASPGITIEMDSPTHPRSFNDSVFTQSKNPTPQSGFATPLHHSSSKNRSSRNTDTLSASGHGNTHLSVPEQGGGWYRPIDRSVSPVSPRISPSPKAMKPATPNLSIRVTADSPERTSSGIPTISQPMPSPRSLQHRRSSGVPHGPGPGGSTPSSRPRSAHFSKSTPSSASQTAAKHNMLMVPGIKGKDADSMSSLSSGYYPGSSRSGTNSPSTPDALQGHRSWYTESPPDSPQSKNPHADFTREASPSPFHRTSSTHRPLGVSMQSNPPEGNAHSAGGAKSENQWQRENWNHWKALAQEHGDDFHGQETLV